MIGQVLPIVGEPKVVTLSSPSRLTRSPPPVSWPKVFVSASMVVANVPPDPCMNTAWLPPVWLSARVPLASIVNVPSLLVRVAPL